ncbi:hypothetical protein Taro_036002, partial [Colocasia esculenta]|nr:hypothetical protein [Colocasia esculenta]
MTISQFPRFSGCSVSLDYANRWWGNHMGSACQDDRMLCSTRRENSSPGRRITYVTTIRNRHFETIDRALVSQNSVSRPKFHRGACVLVHRLSYPLGRMRIFVRPTIGTARDALIQNRHFDL